jgi:hypothetical protein
MERELPLRGALMGALMGSRELAMDKDGKQEGWVASSSESESEDLPTQIMEALEYQKVPRADRNQLCQMMLRMLAQENPRLRLDGAGRPPEREAPALLRSVRLSRSPRLLCDPHGAEPVVLPKKTAGKGPALDPADESTRSCQSSSRRGSKIYFAPTA